MNRCVRRGTALLMPMAMALGLLAVRVSAQAPAGKHTEANLYQRLGGYDAIAGFVDLALPRVAANPKLGRLFQGHSQDSQLRLRQLIIDMLCRTTGGPCVYIGRPLKPAHTGLGITAEDWKTFIDIIRNALEERRVPAAERAELLQIFEQRFRPDVVEKP